MPQNDYVISNDTAANVRADINSALAAVVSQSSGATEPSTTYANMMWYDTTTNILKMRSEANDVWISLGTLDQGTNTFSANVATLDQATWNTGTSTTEAVISPLKLSETSLGRGQTWQDVSGSRAVNTSYQNLTGKPIMVAVSANGTPANFEVSVNNSTWISISSLGRTVSGTSYAWGAQTIIPDNYYYRVNGSTTLVTWVELRS